jgi:hypothetical protein
VWGKKKAQHLTIKSIPIIGKSCVLPPRIAWGFVKIHEMEHNINNGLFFLHNFFGDNIFGFVFF